MTFNEVPETLRDLPTFGDNVLCNSAKPKKSPRMGFASRLGAFLSRDSIIVEREFNDMSFDRSHEIFVDVMVTDLVTFGVFLLEQPNPVPLDSIDSAHRSVVLTDDFHMFSDP
jgi:hypothetical protein